MTDFAAVPASYFAGPSASSLRNRLLECGDFFVEVVNAAYLLITKTDAKKAQAAEPSRALLWCANSAKYIWAPVSCRRANQKSDTDDGASYPVVSRSHDDQDDHARGTHQKLPPRTVHC